jgi:CRP-like cAMP-binding protein
MMAKGVASSRNQILGRLNQADYDGLRAQLQVVSLNVKQVIQQQGRRIDYAYFPESCVVSLVQQLGDGKLIETATVGNEGMVGLTAAFGLDASPFTAVCQIPGEAVRLRADVLLAERRRGGQLADLVLRFANATIAMLSQSAACNRAHSLEERMCRWLLMTHDRVDADSFPLTQEFVAQMLGVRRPTVNLAGRSLQRAGLIRYVRGKITILDRKGMEETACECYSDVRAEFARSLGENQKQRKTKR